MQEDVEQKTLMLIVNGSKFTGRLLKAAITKYMAYRKEVKLEKQRKREMPVAHRGQADGEVAHTAKSRGLQYRHSGQGDPAI